MASIADFEALVPLDHGLSTVAISRGDQAPQVTVVNAGVVEHPVTAERMVAFVAAGRARKLNRLRADPALAVTVRAGWQWVTSEGRAELIGPDDPHPRCRRRTSATPAPGDLLGSWRQHDDWPGYDQTMRPIEDRHPRRVPGNDLGPPTAA